MTSNERLQDLFVTGWDIMVSYLMKGLPKYTPLLESTPYGIRNTVDVRNPKNRRISVSNTMAIWL